MEDAARALLLQQVHELVEKERKLREHLADPHDPGRISDRDVLHQVEEELDQC